VEASLLGRLRQGERYTRLEAEEPPDAKGWANVEMRFEEEHDAVEFILSFGDRIEVVAPDRLRALVIAQAEAVLARYAHVSASTGQASSGGALG
jgi:predicted DNA-binding transcriptional regulator YafY